MHMFDLNEDVLAEIISLAGREDLIKFAATSHFAHDLCMPHIISTVRITRAPEYLLAFRIRNFCTFMLARWKERIPCLRHFSFDPVFLAQWPSDGSTFVFHNETLKLLGDVLDHAQNLESLEVQNCERLLVREPRIANALTRCARLTTISLDNISSNRLGQLSIALMQELAGIRHINLGLTHSNLAAVLSASHSTLESVSFEEKFSRFPDLFNRGLEWPHVRQLELHIHPSTALNISRAFPNVRELRVDGDKHRVIQVGRVMSCKSWTQLDYVEGPMPALYLLRLTSHIRELRIPYSLTHGEQQQTGFGSISRTNAFLDLVHIANPEILSFAVDLRSKLADITFFRGLAQVAPLLNFLAISVTYSITVIHNLVCTFNR
jgi:hypothetical protein